MDNKLNIRLKQLRVKYGYKSQQALADAIHVDRSLVKSWERENNPVLPRLDNLIAMCSLYNCDLDYLIGRIKERTHDIKTACELTGLSEVAIEKITKAKPYRSRAAATLSKLIETENFSGLVLAYQRFLDSAANLKESALEPPNYNLNDIETVVLSRDEATRFFMRRVADEMLIICDGEYRKQFAAAIDNEKKKLESESEKEDEIENGDE